MKTEQRFKRRTSVDKILDLYKMFLDPLKVKTRLSRKSDNSSETVAEHSWSAAILVLVLAPELGWDGHTTLAVLKRVLCHDLVEAFSGDFSVKVQEDYPKIKALKALVEKETQDMIPNIYIKSYTELAESEDDGHYDKVKLVDKLDWVLQNIAVSDRLDTPISHALTPELMRAVEELIDDTELEASGIVLMLHKLQRRERLV